MKPFLFTVGFLIFSQITIAQTTNPSPYCDASFDDAQGFYVDDHINSVSFGSLNNVTNNQYAAPHYVFYNNLSIPDFAPTHTYTLTVNFTTAGGCGYGVWIDFNNNHVFEPSEKVAGTFGTEMLEVGASPTITKQVTIPIDAVLGNTRMRVRIIEDDLYNSTTTNELPCNAGTDAENIMDWGETEDYIINIANPTGINNISSSIAHKLYPNPTTGILTLTELKSAASVIEVYSVLGTVVYHGQMNSSTVDIDLSHLPKGIYFVKLINDNEVIVTEKVILK